MKTIVIVNQKGGVGKTTTTATLAHWFAMHGKRVLALDMDGQGHLAAVLGRPRTDGLYRLLVQRRALKDVVVEARPGLDVVANDHTAEQIKSWAQSVSFREYLVGEALRQAVGYDLVFIDTPPSTDLLHVASLVAADYAIVPAGMDYLALDGVGYVFNTLRQLAAYPNVVPPQVIGILPVMFDRTTSETAGNVKRVQETWGTDLLLPPVPRDTKVREAASYGETIWEHAPESAAAIGFMLRGAKATNGVGRVGGYLHAAEIIARVMGIVGL